MSTTSQLGRIVASVSREKSLLVGPVASLLVIVAAQVWDDATESLVATVFHTDLRLESGYALIAVFLLSTYLVYLHRVLRTMANSALCQLNDREREVLARIRRGHTDMREYPGHEQAATATFMLNKGLIERSGSRLHLAPGVFWFIEKKKG